MLNNDRLITKLKYRFAERFPFLSSLSNNIDVSITDEPIPLPNGGTTTACCSDTKIILYRKFLEDSFDKALGTYSHEVMHIALMHTARYNEYSKQGLGFEWKIGYNILADLRINEILKHEGIQMQEGIVDKDNIEAIIQQNGFKLHKGVGQLEDLIKCVNADDLLSTDRAFNMFRTYYKYEGNGGGGDRGKWRPDLKEGEKQPKDVKDDIERKIINGLVGGKQAGSSLSDLGRMFEKQFYARNIDYSQVIKNSLVRELQRVVDYNRVHKKSIELEFEPYMPRWSDIPNKYHVAVAIDSSGSMWNDTINKICGELFKLITRYPVSFDVYTCDTAIRDRFMDITKVDKLKKIKQIGGQGGTSYKPVFKELEKVRQQKGRKRRNYKTLLYFTDGYGDNNSLKPIAGLKVFWIVDDAGKKIKFPFGTVCMIK